MPQGRSFCALSRSRISPSSCSSLLGIGGAVGATAFALEAVDGFDAHEDRESDNHEIQHRLQEFAVSQHHGGRIALGGFERDGQITEIDPTDQQAGSAA